VYAAPARSVAAADGRLLKRGYTVARGEVAQSVEHTAENRGVAGSIPALAINRHFLSGGVFTVEQGDALREFRRSTTSARSATTRSATSTPRPDTVCPTWQLRQTDNPSL
jgi:hypothetical protein